MKAERSIRATFAMERVVAKRRGLTFALTFEEWWALWAPHWTQRGRRVGDRWMVPIREELGLVAGNAQVATLTAAMRARWMPPEKKPPAITRRGVHCSHAAAPWLSERGMPGDYINHPRPDDDDEALVAV